MPFTLLHYVVAYLAGKWKPRLSFPGLIVGSVSPDLDMLICQFVDSPHGRGILHSLFGVATIGTALSVFFTVYLYPTVVSRIFRIDKTVVKDRCRFSKGLLFACFVGNILHVLVDSLHHPYNPTLYPFVNESFDALVLFSNWQLATMVVQLVLFVLLVTIFMWEAVGEEKGFWKRLLVS